LDDDGVSIEDPGIDHGIARDLEGVVVATAQHATGNGHLGNLVLQGFDRRTGGDPADHGHVHGTFTVAHGAPGTAGTAGIGNNPRLRAAVPRACRAEPQGLAARGGRTQGFRDIVRQLHDFERPRALLHAAQEPALLKRRDQPVDTGFGFEVQRVLHFIERRRDAALAYPLVDEHQKLVLFAGEHCSTPPLSPLRTNPKHGESFYFSS